MVQWPTLPPTNWISPVSARWRGGSRAPRPARCGRFGLRSGNSSPLGTRSKDVCAWLNEIGIEIGYARLSDYVNQLRRAQPDSRESRTAIQTPPPAPPPTTPQTVGAIRTEEIPAKRDPLANLHRSEAKRPGFQYRAAVPADEKDLI